MCREGLNFALAEIDLDYVAQVRASMPVRLQRRPDLYGELRLQDKIPSKSESFRNRASLPKAIFMSCSFLMSFYPAKFRFNYFLPFQVFLLVLRIRIGFGSGSGFGSREPNQCGSRSGSMEPNRCGSGSRLCRHKR
jgi:hypothetical protein